MIEVIIGVLGTAAIVAVILFLSYLWLKLTEKSKHARRIQNFLDFLG